MTDIGNYIVDLHFDTHQDAVAAASDLKHGRRRRPRLLFIGMTTAVIAGKEGISVKEAHGRVCRATSRLVVTSESENANEREREREIRVCAVPCILGLAFSLTG